MDVQGATMPLAGSGAGLNPEERRRLTLWKWQYGLESQGFTTDAARALLFLRWYWSGRTQGEH